MSAQSNLLEQLEHAFAHRDIWQRTETLRRVTDLFVSGSGKFTDEQIALFDEVMTRLVAEIDVAARAAFGERLAPVADAPPRVIRGLALDDDIEVAGPVLTLSERLDEATLVESARNKSQSHLLAISRRRELPEQVTDVLVERGDRDVALSAAANTGARFSSFGYSTLVQRAHDDGGIALAVWTRPEVPRQHLLALFAEASETVRQQLETADHANGGLLQDVIARASNRIQADMREGSATFRSARDEIVALHRSGALDSRRIARLATAGRFDEVTVALSLMGELSIGVIERALANQRTEQILVLAKAIGLDWEATRAVLLLQSRGSSTVAIEQCCETYARLQAETARKAIQFYRLRERAVASN